VIKFEFFSTKKWEFFEEEKEGENSTNFSVFWEKKKNPCFQP
jgi:hypothetical protein